MELRVHSAEGDAIPTGLASKTRHLLVDRSHPVVRAGEAGPRIGTRVLTPFRPQVITRPHARATAESSSDVETCRDMIGTETLLAGAKSASWYIPVVLDITSLLPA